MADIEIIEGADNGNPPDTLREMYPKVNRNFQRINSELTGHIGSTTAHKAEDITYTGLVPGNDVKVAIDNVNTRISEIVAQSGDDITEVVDARGGYDVLGDRLNAMDAEIQEIAKDSVIVYNPVEYGADPTGVAESTVAIQEAVNACGAAGGGLVYLPKGTYLSGTVKIKKSNIFIAGAGNGATKIILKPMNNGACIQIADYNDTTIRGTVQNIRIEDLEIDGNRDNQLNGSTDADGINIGIRVEDADTVTLQRLKIHHCDGYGIGIVGSDLPNRADLVVRDVETFSNAYDGLDIKAGFQRALLSNVYSHNNGGGAISARDAVGFDVRGEYVRVENCIAESNEDHGFRIRSETDSGALGSGAYIDITNCRSVNNTLDGFSIDGINVGEYVLSSCYAVGNRYGFTKEFGNLTLNNCISTANRTDGIYVRETGTGVCSINGGSVTKNTQDGVRAGNVTMLKIDGILIQMNGRRGINVSGSTRLQIDSSTLEGNGVTNRDNGVGILLSAVTMSWMITNCKIFDEKSTAANKSQKYGVQFSGTNAAGILTANDLTGNWTSGTFGTIPTGSVNVNNLT